MKKLNKMNRTKDELLLECINQFEHIESVLGYNRLSTTRSLINEINQALTIPEVNERINRGKVMTNQIINRTFIFE